MDKAERQRLKQLANDSVIATFGQDTNEAKLAQALEQSIEELGFIAEECEHCKLCPCHGDRSDEPLPVDASEVLDVHAELKKLLQQFKDYHVRLSGDLAEWETSGELGLRLPEDLAAIVEDMENELNELERCVIP